MKPVPKYLTVVLTFVSVILLFNSCSSTADMPAPRPADKPLTLILGAFDAEVKLLEEHITEKHEEYIHKIKFITGELYGRDIVLAESGIGKVNAGLTTAIAITRFQPEQVIFSGIAGGINPSLNPGDIVIGEKVFQHDYGIITNDGFATGPTKNPFTRARNPVIFTADNRLVKTAEVVSANVRLQPLKTGTAARTPVIIKGVIATGDMFVASDTKKAELQAAGADAVEMEGGAVAQVCMQYGVDFIIIRSLSDTADSNAREDIELFYQTAANNSANLVMGIVKRLASPAETTTK